MIKLENITILNNGKRLEYKYSISPEIQHFFKKEEPFFIEYDVDVSSVPFSILAVPFLANVLPISWFAGFNISLTEVDEMFYDAVSNLKKEFAKHYPIILSNESSLIVDRLITNESLSKDGRKNAMLFSGGVDAYTTFIRNYEDTPDLITILGADIKLSDKKQWDDFLLYNKTTRIIQPNQKYYIKSNIRDFITFEVDKLIPNLGWWGKIQHGFALTTLTAPLAYFKSYKTIFIASTRSSQMPFSTWGSMPETDNLIRWSDQIINHDGYELSRFNKVETIVSRTKELNIKPQLRVCYNEYKTTLNCNECEKCVRTIFGIMLNNEDPSKYGFVIDNSLYDIIAKHLSRGFKSHGTKFYWNEMLLEYGKKDFYYLNNQEKENLKIEEIIAIYTKVKDLPIGVVSDKQKYKNQLINQFPRLFNLYLKVRRKFL